MSPRKVVRRTTGGVDASCSMARPWTRTGSLQLPLSTVPVQRDRCSSSIADTVQGRCADHWRFATEGPLLWLVSALRYRGCRQLITDGEHKRSCCLSNRLGRKRHRWLFECRSSEKSPRDVSTSTTPQVSSRLTSCRFTRSSTILSVRFGFEGPLELGVLPEEACRSSLEGQHIAACRCNRVT